MIFIDLSRITKGEQEAQQDNFKDLNNLIKADLNIQRANEFFGAAPGREAAIKLESDRRVQAADLLQPNVGFLAQSAADSILGNAATRSVRGRFDTTVADLTLPKIPVLAGNQVDALVATSGNRLNQTTVLTPQQQAIQEQRQQFTIDNLDTTQNIQREGLNFQNQNINQRQDLVTSQLNQQTQQAQLVDLQSKLANLNLVSAEGLSQPELIQRAAPAISALRAANLMGPQDTMLTDPNNNNALVIARIDGSTIPITDLVSQINSRLVPGTRTAPKTTVKRVPNRDENGQIILDANGNITYYEEVTTVTSGAPSTTRQTNAQPAVATSTTVAATNPTPNAPINITGDLTLPYTAEQRVALRDVELRRQQAAAQVEKAQADRILEANLTLELNTNPKLVKEATAAVKKRNPKIKGQLLEKLIREEAARRAGIIK